MKEEVAHQVASTAVQAAISKSPYLGVTVTIIAGYSLNEWLAIVGIVFTTLTFFLNWHMQRQRLKIMREEFNKKHVRASAAAEDEHL